MNEYFPHLFEPIKIGKTTVKNRIFMPPISTNMADKGYVTDALVEHYSARAKGGVGLIVTEVTTVEPVYTYLPGDMSIYDAMASPKAPTPGRMSRSALRMVCASAVTTASSPRCVRLERRLNKLPTP